MKKIPITGCARFIGFHLACCLLKDRWQIVDLDNSNDYYDVNLKYAWFQQLGIAKPVMEYDNGTLIITAASKK